MSVDEAIFEWPYVMMKRLFYIFGSSPNRVQESMGRSGLKVKGDKGVCT